VTVDGTAILTNTYDATDQVVGWTSDHAGNLTGDGTTSYHYGDDTGVFVAARSIAVLLT
jgi:hypothetical protein